MRRGPSWSFSERGRWLLIGLSFLLGLLFMWCGFRVSSTPEYIAALLAALGANALVVGVGLILLDHFQRARRRKEWERVTRVVLSEAKEHLINVGHAGVIAFQLSEGQAQARLVPKPGRPDTAAEGLGMLDEEINAKFEAARGSRGEEDRFASDALKFLAKSEARCGATAQLLRDISQAEIEGDLIESFVGFGQMFRSVSIHVETMRRSGLPMVAIFLAPHVSDLLRAAAKLYGAILTATSPAGEAGLFKPGAGDKQSDKP